MQTVESQYGREPITIDDKVPTFHVDWLLGRVHVTTSDAEVARNFRDRLERSDTAHPKQLADDVIRYALWRHAENRAEYNYVMGGH